MILRELNDAGIVAFRRYLADARANAALLPPVELLEDPAFTNTLPVSIEVLPREFESRREAADYLLGVLAPLGEHVVATNAGLWTWLSLFYFDQVCTWKAGARLVRNDYHYVFEPKNSRHFYRHLLFIAWRVITLAPKHNRLFLDSPVTTLDKVISEVLKRLYITRVKCVFEVLDRIYWDNDRGRVRPGIVSQHAVRPGDLYHRFPIRMRQLEKTYDLVEIPTDHLIELLGDEFDLTKTVAKPKRSTATRAKA